MRGSRSAFSLWVARDIEPGVVLVVEEGFNGMVVVAVPGVMSSRLR